MMRKIFAVVVCLLTLFVGSILAQTPVVGPTDAIGFDYPDADLATYVVNRFEASYDSGAWNSINIPPVAAVIGGVTTYRVVPPQASGNHTVAFRACNAVGCSGSSGPFAFAVLGVPGSAPGNIRKIPR